MIKEVLKLLEKYNIIPLIIAILIAITIFYLSSIPASGFPGGLGIMTKIYHIGIFFLLGFFLSIAIIRGKINKRLLIISVILFAIIYACSDEIHQLFVPGRHCTIKDVFIDTTGIIIASVFYLGLKGK